MESMIYTGLRWGAALSIAANLLSCYNLPEPRVSEKSVLDAAVEVIQTRYPNSSPSVQNGFVLAVTPLALEGLTKTRRQISVDIRRTYAGNYEPVVRVRHVAELGTTVLRADPETDDLGAAAPLADRNEWRTLGSLPTEEVELTNAILAKIQPRGM